MEKVYKCALCSLPVEKNLSVKYKDKNYHSACYKSQIDREELCKYICFLFGFKAPGPKIYSQIKTFADKYGYTHEGMLRALRYHYDVKKGSIKDAKDGIGIVPFIYDEAQDYFKKLDHKKSNIAEAIEKQLTKEECVLITEKPKAKREAKLIAIDELGGN